MSVYSPPTENLQDFNSSAFTTANTSTLSLAKATALFLGRTGTPNSTATSTTFNGTISTSGAINGITLATNATGGTKIGTLDSFTNTTCGNCVLLGDSLLVGNTPSSTHDDTLIGTNIGTGGDLQRCIGIGQNIFKTALNQAQTVAIGYNSCFGGGGSSTTAVGDSSATVNVGNFNTALGASSLSANTNGTSNVAVGYSAFSTGTAFTNSTALGSSTVITGTYGTAVGSGASAGANQVVLGRGAETVYLPGTSTTLGSLQSSADIYINGIRAGNGAAITPSTAFQTCFGNGTLALSTTGIQNTGFGYNCLTTSNANQNTAIGALALQKITSGSRNVAVGSDSCKGATFNGSRITAVGTYSGQAMTGSIVETTLVGYYAGGNANGGSYNTFVGAYASQNLSSNSSTAIGSYSACGAYNFSTAIGGGSNTVAGATNTANNQIMLGTALETVQCPGTQAGISLRTTANAFINGYCFGTGNGDTNSLFTGLTDGTGNGANNTLYGRGSYIPNSADGSSFRNTIIGAGSMTSGASSYSDSTVIGYNSNNTGLTSNSANNITMLGSNCSVSGNYGTAIGSGAVAGANQVVLGTTAETTYLVGVPTTGSTPYTSLVLYSGLQLQTVYSVVPSANQLGYKTSTTGSPIVLTSGITSNLNTVAIPAGTWSISFSVSCLAGTGNVTASNIVWSATTASIVALNAICGQIKKHSSEIYALNDTYIVSNCFTYQTSTATTIYLNMSFTGTSTTTATGSVSLTRIA